jgi:hypothetical protein
MPCSGKPRGDRALSSARRQALYRASSEQQKSIEDALAKWEFKPYQVNSHPAEIETGLVFEFNLAIR